MRSEKEIRKKHDKIVNCSSDLGCTPYICMNCSDENLCKNGREFAKWVLNDEEEERQRELNTRAAAEQRGEIIKDKSDEKVSK